MLCIHVRFATLPQSLQTSPCSLALSQLERQGLAQALSAVCAGGVGKSKNKKVQANKKDKTRCFIMCPPFLKTAGTVRTRGGCVRRRTGAGAPLNFII